MTKLTYPILTGEVVLRIEYENPKVQALFDDMELVQTSKNLMIKKIGKELARGVKKRYDQLKAASNFDEYRKMGLGKPHALSGNRSGDYAIHINANYRLIVRPKEGGSNVSETMNTIIIKGVTDYHEKGNDGNWIIP